MKTRLIFYIYIHKLQWVDKCGQIWYNVSENNSRGDTMKFVFLIGNGFDLNLNLKTRYRNFYDRYISLPSKNSTIKKFKEVLSDNLDNWADLELELGKYANNFLKYLKTHFYILDYLKLDLEHSCLNILGKLYRELV